MPLLSGLEYFFLLRHSELEHKKAVVYEIEMSKKLVLSCWGVNLIS